VALFLLVHHQKRAVVGGGGRHKHAARLAGRPAAAGE
jgi:hypothetical protein